MRFFAPSPDPTMVWVDAFMKQRQETKELRDRLTEVLSFLDEAFTHLACADTDDPQVQMAYEWLQRAMERRDH